MFKAIKECMKNWLMAHERLYWYIVIGLAVFGFGLMTAIGCAKLYDANAAEYVDYQANRDYKAIYETACNWVENSSLYGAEYLEAYPYRIVVCGWGDMNTSASVYFFAEPVGFALGNWGNNDYTIPETLSVSVALDGYKIVSASIRTSFRADIQSLRYTTYDIYNGDDLVVEQTRETKYSSSAPYLKFSNRTWRNAFFLDRNMDFNDSYFKFTFDVEDSSEEVVIGREVEFSAYVYLPSKELIDKLWEKYKDNNISEFGLSSYVHVASGDYYPQWLQLLENENNVVAKKYAVRFTVNCDSKGQAVLKVSHEDIINEVESKHGFTIEEYYDLEGLTTKDSYMENIIMSYLWVSRLDGIVYTTYEDRIEYSNVVSFAFSSYLSDPVVVVGNSDPLSYGRAYPFIGPMLPDTEVQTSISQAYQDALEQAMKENQELVNSMNGLDAAFGDLSGSGLWDGFKGLAGGLSSLGPSLTSIGSLIGSVFSFIPAPVSGIITFTFFALCVIAIIKAIRG